MISHDDKRKLRLLGYVDFSLTALRRVDAFFLIGNGAFGVWSKSLFNTRKDFFFSEIPHHHEKGIGWVIIGSIIRFQVFQSKMLFFFFFFFYCRLLLQRIARPQSVAVAKTGDSGVRHRRCRRGRVPIARPHSEGSTKLSQARLVRELDFSSTTYKTGGRTLGY